jgi:hypothetical protein
MPGVQEINRNDLGVMGAGVVFLIATFLPFYGLSYKGSLAGLGSYSWNAWHSYGVLGVLLVLAAAIIIAVKTFSAMPTLPVGLHVLAAGLAALGTLLLILRAFTYPTAHGAGASIGVKWGAYVVFIAGIAEVAFALLGMRESGEKVAWQSGPSAPADPPAAPPPA